MVSTSTDERSCEADTASLRAASADFDASWTDDCVTRDDTTRELALSLRRYEVACAPLAVVVTQLPSRSCSRLTQGFEVDGLIVRWSIETLPILALPVAAAAEAFQDIEAACSPCNPPMTAEPKLTIRLASAQASMGIPMIR